MENLAWPEARNSRSVGTRLIALAALICGGCGGGLTSSGYSASGTVTWKGRPLEQGTIQFLPDGGQAPMVGGEIKDGQYVLPNPPGLLVGTYRVRINSRSGPAGPRDSNLTDPRSKEQIPPEYNEKTTLKAEVIGGGSKTFAFELLDPGDRGGPLPGGR